MKTIAIVTGATGGIGEAFVKELRRGSFDEIWCIARDQGKLEALQHKYGKRIRSFSLDLTKEESLEVFQACLEKEAIRIGYLINNAGMGETFGTYQNSTLDSVNKVIRLNCTAVVSLGILCLLYMSGGSKIINIASQSVFQPLPYLNLYASTKAFLRNYTRALNVKLRERGITATVVCTGWVDTGMLTTSLNGKKVSYPGMVSASRVAQQAIYDARRDKAISVCSVFVKASHVAAKLMPQSLVMEAWLLGIRSYTKGKQEEV